MDEDADGICDHYVDEDADGICDHCHDHGKPIQSDSSVKNRKTAGQQRIITDAMESIIVVRKAADIIKGIVKMNAYRQVS